MYKEIELILKSKRNTNVFASLIEADVKGPAPLVIFVHGFKVDRSEGGRFTTVGKALAEKGIHSITMSFAGCEGSNEDFINYSIESCLDDIDLEYQYMKDHYQIDMDHVGMVGYSMGGRLTAIYSHLHPEIRTIGLWAAACFTAFDGKEEFLGGNVEMMEKDANEKGYHEYLNTFDNTYIKLSKKFFECMRNYDPEAGLKAFKGNAIVCHGTADITVDPSIAYRSMDNLVNAQNKKLVMIDDANHGFGLWDGHMEQSKILTDETTSFFLENL